jgi:hypothetical protein
MANDTRRQQAREAALEAFGIERVFTNHYFCKYCDQEWSSQWSCAADDDCSGCGRAYSPYDYDIEDEHEEEEESP